MVAQLMRGIYSGVKVGNLALAEGCFSRVARAMVARHALGTLVLGCTEIPLALAVLPGVELGIVFKIQTKNASSVNTSCLMKY